MPFLAREVVERNVRDTDLAAILAAHVDLAIGAA
jgi:hypothetical protein